MQKIKLLNITTSLSLVLQLSSFLQTQNQVLGVLELHIIETEFHSNGHAYLRYHNLSDTNWHYIGYDKVAPNGYFTVGRWGGVSSGGSSSQSGSSLGPGFDGIYYNREEFIYTRISQVKTDCYVTTIIDNMEELNNLSTYISNVNDGYKLFSKNCAHFVYDAFNVVAEENEKLDKSFVKPFTLRDYLKEHPHLNVLYESFYDYNATYYTYYENGQRKTSQYI